MLLLQETLPRFKICSPRDLLQPTAGAAPILSRVLQENEENGLREVRSPNGQGGGDCDNDLISLEGVRWREVLP